MLRSALIIFISFFALASCAVNPVTGKRELSIISASQEVQMGAENYVPYQQQQGGRYVVDPDLGRYVSEVGQRIAAVSDRSGLPFEFVVLNNSVPNAWALPGGKIAINRGLLVELKDEAQLAAVLGHEIVHVAAKHSVQKMQQSQILGLGVVATAVLTRDTDYGEVATAGAGLGAGLWAAKYGREQELQSDAVGMEYMVRAGYDPRAAVELQETFVRLSQNRANQGWLQGLFASHPPSQERVEKNRAMAAQLGSVGTRNTSGFHRAIAQLKKDQPAYELHMQALAAASNDNFDEAIRLLDRAIAIQPQEALFFTAKGQVELANKRDSRAAEAFTKALSLNPDYYVGHLGLGLIQKKQNRLAQAKPNLLNSTKLLPTQIAYFHLGEIEMAEGNRDAAITYFQRVAQQGGELGERATAHLQTLSQPAPAQ